MAFGLGGFGDPFADALEVPPLEGVRGRLAEIKEAIARTCVRAGRDPRSVRLVGVTKLQSVAEIKEAIDAGLEDLGENYVQEARQKAMQLPGAKWHLIGHLQKNKVHLAVQLFQMLHTLDSADLIQRVEQRCHERGQNLSGLIQVKLGGEPTKSGIQPGEIFRLLDQVSQSPPSRLKLVGLMAIPPQPQKPDDTRPYFRQLRSLLEQVQQRGYPFWAGAELSMGMSLDYLVAIEEGATLVRLGTAIFGPRS
ncbi:MAG: YggS family pyridoxal phosphate-dependent enzyme [Candidatus Eremiobacterota bacterium]